MGRRWSVERVFIGEGVDKTPCRGERKWGGRERKCKLFGETHWAIKYGPPRVRRNHRYRHFRTCQIELQRTSKPATGHSQLLTPILSRLCVVEKKEVVTCS
ncbi:hypothetical protein AMTRI_Chr11g95050 [Amborella trichopoda]